MNAEKYEKAINVILDVLADDKCTSSGALKDNCESLLLLTKAAAIDKLYQLANIAVVAAFEELKAKAAAKPSTDTPPPSV